MFEKRIDMTALTFLQENNHKENLNTLANAAVTPKGTFCTTNKVYSKTPYFAPSQTRIREIAIGLGSAILLASAWAVVIPKFFSCMSMKSDWQNNFASTGFQCLMDTIDFSENRLHTIEILFASSLCLWCIGAYAAASYLLRDKSKSARFEALDVVYTEVAKQLIDLKENAKTDEEKDQVVQIAKKIEANKNLIQFSLQQTVKLEETQAKCLSEKIAAAARSILPQDPAKG
jgi:hypothetical protein